MLAYSSYMYAYAFIFTLICTCTLANHPLLQNNKSAKASGTSNKFRKHSLTPNSREQSQRLRQLNLCHVQVIEKARREFPGWMFLMPEIPKA